MEEKSEKKYYTQPLAHLHSMQTFSLMQRKEKKKITDRITEWRTGQIQYSSTFSKLLCNVSHNWAKLNKLPKEQQLLTRVQHAQKVKYGLFSNQGR